MLVLLNFLLEFFWPWVFFRNGQKSLQLHLHLDFLKKTLAQYVEQEEIQTYLDKLNDINSKLWKIEDDIRDCEREKSFSDTFIELARSVYFTNDRRSKVKLEINLLLNSNLVEEKSYKDYS